MTEYLRLSGMYWGLTALDLMHEDLNQPEVLTFVQECLYPCGGFGAHPGHDPHLLYTLSAIQVCKTHEILNHTYSHTLTYL